ncbi:hypothetical protein OG392_00640 [Streptomyces sp. NBC_00691]|nr:hypothetical protein [Streptomyces sp. NBC_00691]
MNATTSTARAVGSGIPDRSSSVIGMSWSLETSYALPMSSSARAWPSISHRL